MSDREFRNWERLTVPKPAPVADSKSTLNVDWPAVIVVVICVIGIAVGLSRSQEPSPLAETWPDNGPSSVFGQTLAPEPIPCPDCTCPDCSWLARFVGALDDQSANPREIRDVLHRSFTESRFTPAAVSATGDYGICQINRVANPDVDVDRLLTDPVYAAGECLRVYRVMFDTCGADWQCCYRYGVRGCKGRVTAAGGGK